MIADWKIVNIQLRDKDPKLIAITNVTCIMQQSTSITQQSTKLHKPYNYFRDACNLCLMDFSITNTHSYDLVSESCISFKYWPDIQKH